MDGFISVDFNMLATLSIIAAVVILVWVIEECS